MRSVRYQFHPDQGIKHDANIDADDSDEERHVTNSAPMPLQQYSDPSYGQQPYGAPAMASGPPGVLPATDADGDSVSSSDREEVQEARADYEEAIADASSGSSSDQEEIEEAREEYVSRFRSRPCRVAPADHGFSSPGGGV